MKIEELRRYVRLGEMPVPVFIKNVYSGIHVVIRTSKNNVVFLDFEDNVSTEGNLRITFKFKTFEDMVCSIEEYTGVNIETLDIADELCKYSSASDANWQQLKIDLYNHNIPMLKNYEMYSIGDLYWNGLFSKEITPWSDMDEIRKWAEKL